MIESQNLIQKLRIVLENLPADWLKLTTHRLDIYHEELAKTEFLVDFERLVSRDFSVHDLAELPTAYDYIRLGHPLSSVFEWYLAKQNGVDAHGVISFQSRTMPILAILRKNLFAKAKTRVVYNGSLPECLNLESLQTVYGYNLETVKLDSESQLPAFEGTTIYLDENNGKWEMDNAIDADFYLLTDSVLGSVVVAKSEESQEYVSEIQHVRRRESIAMTPANCLVALNAIAGNSNQNESLDNHQINENRNTVLASIRNITATQKDAVIGSSGLSVQYAIMMGLADHAQQNHPGKAIKFMVPPNCYGGTNDQARRVAACLENVEVVDLPVDREHDMVNSVEQVLTQVAEQDAVPYIIAEIPTNPRVEVPDLVQLKAVLAKPRTTPSGEEAISPVFILDQTFCPNVQFLGENGFLSGVKTISYVSGSKFPSGGKCTAGYCVANQPAESLLEPINQHMATCDNYATDLQMSFLAEQMPSMLSRIEKAYANTREFVNYIIETLPTAKINFVSEELAAAGFTPSVFSLDLPTKGETHHERELYKRALNQKLINMMIGQIPTESKYCVSYGQLKGCYWTIPATSTQGTTKEADKDYIARVSVSPQLDLAKHKQVFKEFVEGIG